jgi:hypothetical protein
MRIPSFVSLLITLLSRPGSKVERIEMRVGEGLWRLLKVEGFGEQPHAHFANFGRRRGSVGGHHAVHAVKGAALDGFVGKVEKGWCVVEKRS